MEKIVCLIICILTIILLKYIFKIDLKKAKKLEKNKDLQKITDRFPKNKVIAEEMLELLGNNTTKVEEQKNTKTSLYIAITNKILIADFKNNYGRIGTIAHECIHSVQDKTLLLFNYIFSNVILVYFLVATILTACKVYTNYMLQVFIILILGLIKFAVRGFLETDAMTRSKFFAKDYIKQKNLCTNKETEELINEYEKINKMGILFYLFSMISSLLLMISLYIIISAFC